MCVWDSSYCFFFAGCHEVTDSGILSLCLHCPNLERLSLMGLVHVTDKAVTNLLQHCSQLLQLDLSNCPRVTEQARKQAQHIDVSHIPQYQLKW